MFGAAAVLAIPKTVFDQIVETEPIVIPSGLRELRTFPVNHNLHGTTGAFFYKDDVLVAHADDCDVHMHREIDPLPPIYDGNDEWPRYTPGLRSWKVEAKIVEWFVDPDKCIDDTPLKMIACSRDKTFTIMGDVYLYQSIFYMKHDGEPRTLTHIYTDATFEGSGEAIITLKEG